MAPTFSMGRFRNWIGRTNNNNNNDENNNNNNNNGINDNDIMNSSTSKHSSSSSCRKRNSTKVSNDMCSSNDDGGGDDLYRPPPPLRTSNAYDNDEAFRNVSLNLLSRYEALDLSIEEAIQSTLIDQEQRTAFLEALNFRKFQIRYLFAGNKQEESALLVHRINDKFGSTLKAMSSSSSQKKPSITTTTTATQQLKDKQEGEEDEDDDDSQHRIVPDPLPTPITPRNEHRVEHILMSPRAKNCILPTTTSQQQQRQQRRRRCPSRQRFFPDVSANRKRSRRKLRAARVRNIDWQLATAVQQVTTLNLDDGTTMMQPPPEKKKQLTTTTTVHHHVTPSRENEYKPPPIVVVGPMHRSS